MNGTPEYQIWNGTDVTTAPQVATGATTDGSVNATKSCTPDDADTDATDDNANVYDTKATPTATASTKYVQYQHIWRKESEKRPR